MRQHFETPSWQLRDGYLRPVDIDCLEREFDTRLLCWAKPAPRPAALEPEPRVAVLPRSGRGPRWAVVDRSTGAVIWRYGAEDFSAALREKQRLCRGAGWKSGWCFLVEIKGVAPG